MAQTFSANPIRPTVQTEKTFRSEKVRKSIFSAPFKKIRSLFIMKYKNPLKDYDLVETNLPPGEAFTGFERICDLDRFKKQQTFFNRAYITSDS